MAWSAKARQAAAEARRRHGGARGGTPLQRQYRNASPAQRKAIDRNVSMNTTPRGYADAIYHARTRQLRK